MLQVGMVTVRQFFEIDIVSVELGAPTQAKRTLPPTVTRQPPHMPVPSTIMGLRLAKVCTPQARVSPAAARIMATGPMTWTTPGGEACWALQTRIKSITVPWNPAEPSSVDHSTS